MHAIINGLPVDGLIEECKNEELCEVDGNGVNPILCAASLHSWATLAKLLNRLGEDFDQKYVANRSLLHYLVYFDAAFKSDKSVLKRFPVKADDDGKLPGETKLEGGLILPKEETVKLIERWQKTGAGKSSSGVSDTGRANQETDLGSQQRSVSPRPSTPVESNSRRSETLIAAPSQQKIGPVAVKQTLAQDPGLTTDLAAFSKAASGGSSTNKLGELRLRLAQAKADVTKEKEENDRREEELVATLKRKLEDEEKKKEVEKRRKKELEEAKRELDD